MDPAAARRRWRQKEIDIAPPVAFVLKQLADLPLDTALERLGELEPLTGDHAHCHEVRVGIHVMPLRSPTLPPARHTNSLMIGETHVYVIDPAATDGDERRRLIDQLEHMKKQRSLDLAFSREPVIDLPLDRLLWIVEPEAMRRNHQVAIEPKQPLQAVQVGRHFSTVTVRNHDRTPAGLKCFCN